MSVLLVFKSSTPGRNHGLTLNVRRRRNKGNPVTPESTQDPDVVGSVDTTGSVLTGKFNFNLRVILRRRGSGITHSTRCHCELTADEIVCHVYLMCG